ncbi:hypothetical protein Drose_04130 [Dactylosporangium roseum]|uniref:Uncharacterized protein n=1 Tax=Dactylosporangium roseum TaxID=47989 RepID=A0ABY5Z7M0_9ACTN|nr:hypothetical protein [Dactylosporangium roseum]UWZ37477.1 hypothetical protein Drose_04130 [Dactylosporangium roseum]
MDTNRPVTLAQMAGQRPRRRAGLIAGVAAGAVVLVAATVGVTVALTRKSADTGAPAAASASAAFTAAGDLVLHRGEFTWNSAQDPTCQGMGGFSDLRGGTQVVITDAGGKKLAVGALAAGRAGDFSTNADGTQRAGSCTLAFAVPGVPRGVGPYGVEVSHRGVQTYSEERLDAGIILGFS